MSQTCRLLHTIVSPQLHLRFANNCEPNILRLVKTGNSDALRKLLSAGYKLFDFMETPRLWWKEYFDGDTYMETKLKSRSPMMIAAAHGHLEILQMFIDTLPSTITRLTYRSWHLLSCAALHGQLDVVKFLIGQGVPVDYTDRLGTTRTTLQYAVTGGHFPVVKYIVENTACEDQLQDSAVDLLCCATNAGHLEIVKYLVKCGADFTYPPWGYPIIKYSPSSAFDTAIQQGYEDIVSFFLDNVPPKFLDDMSISDWKSVLNPCDRDEGVLYYGLSTCRKPKIAQMIFDRIDLETKLATTTPIEQAYLLAVAAETGNVSLTRQLLDKGGRPVSSQTQLHRKTFKSSPNLWASNAENFCGGTVCHDAITINASHTPVVCAMNNGHAEIMETFLRCPDYPVSRLDVASAAHKGEEAIVLRLLDKAGKRRFKGLATAALYATSYLDKFIPAMESIFDVLTTQDVKIVISMLISSTGPQASRVGHLEATKFLIEKGGKRPFDEIPSCFGYFERRWREPTSFLEHAAAACPVTQFRAVLAQWNLELDPGNDYCKAALAAAALHKKAETIQVFIERGFDVNSTYLHRGKLSPLLHLVLQPLKHEDGRVVDIDDDERMRIRQLYHPNGHPWLDHVHPRASIQLLIEHGADINQVDSHGRTALFLTTERRTLGLTEELLRLGANPVLKSPGKVSPLELAISQGQAKYVKAFLKAIETRSFACANFVSLIPDVLPVETLPNRASGEQFSVSSRNRLSQYRMLARDGQMGPTKTFPRPCGDIDRRGSTSSEDISTDEEIWQVVSQHSEDNFISIWSATEDDDCISDLRWVRFFIAKAMTQHHWRMMYPVPV
ncbi:hypothetical protein N7517_001608 [Penicillium concentricum]|uniref:Ankyrin n=1 Tax=Penicillium concentricum TaxID=293559 RepID=A0A9W9VJ08_9EURO|nr:uncharacterized protein N7517_001608 [Penicillium concentricum]KAJ5383697.1 hypothetical protein N7517_001608 [Penicillium concentricum]